MLNLGTMTNETYKYFGQNPYSMEVQFFIYAQNGETYVCTLCLRSSERIPQLHAEPQWLAAARPLQILADCLLLALYFNILYFSHVYSRYSYVISGL